jgi:hypothetical protein
LAADVDPVFSPVRANDKGKPTVDVARRASWLFLPNASKRSNWSSAGFAVRNPARWHRFLHFNSRSGSCIAFKRTICPSEPTLRECKK